MQFFPGTSCSAFSLASVNDVYQGVKLAQSRGGKFSLPFHSTYILDIQPLNS
jgi:hypothetical protein